MRGPDCVVGLIRPTEAYDAVLRVGRLIEA